jgi:hypothetical protein
MSDFEKALNSVLNEAYFGSPFEKATGIKRQASYVTEDEDKTFAKMAAGMADKAAGVEHLGRKKAVLDLVDVGRLSQAGLKLLDTLKHVMEMRKLGGSVGAKERGREVSKQLRGTDDSLENLKRLYGDVDLEYIGFDPKHEGIAEGHIFKYPGQVEGGIGSSTDRHGFRIEAILSGPKEYPGLEDILNQTGGTVPLFASDYETTGNNISVFDIVNLFADFDRDAPLAEKPIWTWGAELTAT